MIGTITKYIIGLTCIFMCVNCFAPDPIYVDSRFTNSERLAITWAANEWYKATNGDATLDLVWDQDVSDDDINTYHRQRFLIRATKDTPQLADINLYTADAEDYFIKDAVFHDIMNERMIIVVDRDDAQNDDYIYYAALHEFGHHFGAVHIDNPTSTMYKKYSHATTWDCVTYDDLVDYCTHENRRCRAAGLNFCTEPKVLQAQ